MVYHNGLIKIPRRSEEEKIIKKKSETNAIYVEKRDNKIYVGRFFALNFFQNNVVMLKIL